MKQSQNLYEYLYQVLVSQFLSGAFHPGQAFPTQRELSLRYNVGITTVRKVVKMLDEQGYIRASQGRPSIVVYQAPLEAYISYLAGRRDEIADAYRGMELIMPVLYREGAKRCKEPELRLIRKLIDSISEQMGLGELYTKANIFFSTLLRTMNNQLIMDLEVYSESFLHTPYFPLDGIENPFDLSAARLKTWLQSAVFQIENQRYDDFCASAARLYKESAKRVDAYLCTLGRHIPFQNQTAEEIRWFRPIGRSALYARLTMTMIRRIVSGEFDEQKYLPSIPKLMEEYGVMKDTASRAVSLLNSLGFAQTLDKKGTIFALNGDAVPKSRLNLKDPAVKEQLTLFLNALQIIALTAGSCASLFHAVPQGLAPLMENKLFAVRDNRVSPLSFQLLMNGFIELLPFHSLKNIYKQLDELILWGYYLQSVDKSFYPNSSDTAAAMEAFIAALKSDAPFELAKTYGEVFSLIYRDVCAVVSRLPIVLPI